MSWQFVSATPASPTDLWPGYKGVLVDTSWSYFYRNWSDLAQRYWQFDTPPAWKPAPGGLKGAGGTGKFQMLGKDDATKTVWFQFAADPPAWFTADGTTAWTFQEAPQH